MLKIADALGQQDAGRHGALVDPLADQAEPDGLPAPSRRTARSIGVPIVPRIACTARSSVQSAADTAIHLDEQVARRGCRPARPASRASGVTTVTQPFRASTRSPTPA